MFVPKGDGGLMSLETAREKPVEMVLSGPAASLMGGKALAGIDDCLVIDMGGTSTDIAYLDEGFPRLNVEGAVVGQWRTRVKGIDIWTCGPGRGFVGPTGQEGGTANRAGTSAPIWPWRPPVTPAFGIR